jgi:hypothetical protein
MSFPQIPLMPTCPKLNADEEELLYVIGGGFVCFVIVLVRCII